MAPGSPTGPSAALGARRRARRRPSRRLRSRRRWRGISLRLVQCGPPRLPALGPVIGLGDRAQHLLRPQPRAEPLDQFVQLVALAVVFGQEAGAGAGPGRGLDRAQAQPARRRGQRREREPLGQEAPQVRHVLRGLGRAHRELLVRRQRDAVEPLQVQRPLQLDRHRAALARAQPDLQRRQQAVGRPHELGRALGQRGQLQLLLEHVGQLQPAHGCRARRP